MNDGSLAMTMDNLEDAYQVRDPRWAGHQHATGVVIGSNGVTVAASANASGDADHTWVLHLDFDGSVMWQHHYEPTYGSPTAITRLSRGEFMIAGEVQRNPVAFQASLLRIDSTGNVLGAVTLGPDGDTGFDAIQSLGGDAIVVGGAAAGKGWLVTTDSQFHNPGERGIEVHHVKSIRVLAAGDIAVLGASDRPTLGLGQTTLLWLASDGHLRWRLPLPPSGRGSPMGLVARHDAVIAVGNGSASDGATAQIWLARCEATGAVSWQRAIANARGWAAVGLSDCVAVVGETGSSEGETTQHIWRFGDDGTLRSDQPWRERQVGASLDQTREFVHDIDATDDGGLIVVGSARRGTGKTHVWVVCIAPDGNVRWERVFGDPASGHPLL